MEIPTLSNLFSIIVNLIEAYIEQVKDFTHLIGLEADLAGKTLIEIIILLLALAFFLFPSWLCLQVLLFFYLLTLHYSYVMAALFVALFNLFLVVSCFLTIIKIKKYLFFPATRKQLSRIKNDE